MEKRRITLNDGRYLIYYSFEDEESTIPNAPSESRSEAENKEQKTEKKRKGKCSCDTNG